MSTGVDQMHEDVNAFLDRIDALTEEDIAKLALEIPVFEALGSTISDSIEHAALASGTGAHTLSAEDKASGANLEFAMRMQDRISSALESLDQEVANIIYVACVATMMRSNIGDIFLQEDYDVMVTPFKNALGKVHLGDL
jgi:hypothetical protein